ncbi:MAG: hypothetical protein WCV80_00335 [Candidatus Paceibacterota bacterium]|jgi:hypothetical protein
MFKDFRKQFEEVIVGLLRQWEVWIFLLIAGALITVPFYSMAELWAIVQRFISYTWWFWTFFILFIPFRALFLYWRQQEYKKKEAADEKYVLLELRIPRELQKGPLSMEQVLLSLHSLGNSPGSFHEKYIDGEVPLWFSAEIVSIGGQVHIYMRVPKKNRNLVEATFFSSYADVEVVEVKDYMKDLPATTAELYAQERDMWGTEMKLAIDAAYPIKTYQAFESGGEGQLDPISTFLEVLGKLKKEEVACIQIVLSPADKKWSEKWRSVLEKLREPELFEAGEEKVTIPRTPGQNELANAIETKLSKVAFNTLIRILYIAPKTVFKEGSGFARSGIIGAFNQYSAPNLNSFKQNNPMATGVKPWKWSEPFRTGINKKGEYRKQRLLYSFRFREWPPETFTARLFTSYMSNSNFDTLSFEMSVDELASVFHLPTSIVLTAPHIKRVESKKAGPPSGIAIFGEESHLERFEEKE